MADFRKLFYALAVVALLAGLTVPASAQGVITCNTNASVPTIVRAEAYADLVGDLVLQCTGGTPTTAGQVVPSMNLTVFLSTNITSKLVGTTALGFNEALLIVDEPNAPGANSNRPILNCGAAGAPDTGVVSGPGVCAITSTGNPAQTYDGTLGSSTYGTGRPNVFQGRQGVPQNSGQANAVSFLGVPLDPPGTGTTRTFRITNVRADAESIGISSTFTTSQIVMNIGVTSTTSLSINNPQQLVAYVQRGLIVASDGKGNTTVSRLNFIQCNSENSKLAAGTTIPVVGSVGGINTGFSTTPTVRLQEGFSSAWKVKNISFLANGAFGTYACAGGTCGSANSYNYTGLTTYPADQNQNVPGANYFTESGFEYYSASANPNPNPPIAIASSAVTGASNSGYPFASSTGTGITTAGQATQGTRLALNFSNLPQGANIFVTPIIYLYRQNTVTASIPTPGLYVPNVSTGVAVLTSTDANGNTAFTSAATTGNVLAQVSNNLAVYEVLFDDPLSLEQVDIPVVVAYVANLAANPPGGLPVAGTTTQITAGFAPFYSTAAARQPSATLPVPRFIPGSGPLNLFSIQKCACNLLFPFVSNQLGYDTGIAIANTTTDPGLANGFVSTGPQQGAVTLWYYGQGSNGTAPPASVTSSVVPSGQLLTYVLSTGNTGQGLDNRGAGFQGYIIAQAAFQYCHGYAFITSTGALPTSAGVSEGYLGIVLDTGVNGILPRTLQAAENDAH